MTCYQKHYADILIADLCDEVLMWGAANGVPDDDRRLLGPAPSDDFAVRGRRLRHAVDERYTGAVRKWEATVVERVGRSARSSNCWIVRPHASRCPRTIRRGPRPYRIREQLKPKRQLSLGVFGVRSIPNTEPNRRVTFM